MLEPVVDVPNPPVVPVVLPNPPVVEPVEPNPLPVVPIELPVVEPEPELDPKMLELPNRLLDCAATSAVDQAIAIASRQPLRRRELLTFRMGLAFRQLVQRTR